jgi:hypothetical protein
MAYKHRCVDGKSNEEEHMLVVMCGPAHGIFKCRPCYDPWDDKQHWQPCVLVELINIQWKCKFRK